MATRSQIAHHKATHTALEATADMLSVGKVTAMAAVEWAMNTDGLHLVFSSANPDFVDAAQDTYGPPESAEQFFAEVAQICTAAGGGKLLTAGRETSGAVVAGLSLMQLEIGPKIGPGVRALRANDRLVLALKSGNSGAVDYFEKAAGILMTSSK